MNNIVSQKDIIENEINKNKYFETIILALYNHQIITKEKYKDIINDTLNLLALRMKNYTGGLTHVVSIEEANDLNESNLYTINMYLRNLKLEEAINEILNSDINILYKKGEDSLKDYINLTHLKYVLAKNNYIKNDNYFYNETLNDGLKAFFKSYNQSYKAHLLNITVDYKTCFNMPNSRGILFINEYINNINYENIFCKKFNEIDIQNLLKRIYPNYQDLPINIFEIVLTNALLLKLLNRNPLYLNLNFNDIDKLYEVLNDKDFNNKFDNAFSNLLSDLEFSQGVNKYAYNCLPFFYDEIMMLNKKKILEQITIGKRDSHIYYYTNHRMHIDDYQKFLIKLESTDDDNKVEYIESNLTSLFDLLECFKDSNLDFKYIKAILNKMQILDLMAIKNYYVSREDNYMLGMINNFINTKEYKIKNAINNNYESIIICERV